MKIMIALISNLVAILGVCSACFLAYNGVKGWGWFIVVAIITAVSYEVRSKSENDKT